MSPQFISFSGEDELSEALARRCVAHSLPHTSFFSMRPSQGGKDGVMSKFGSYIDSAAAYHFLVMIDLDHVSCPPSLRTALLRQAHASTIPPRMVLSIAKPEVEAWILGDREKLAEFFGIGTDVVPYQPEELPDPKATLVQLARRSRAYKQDFCPRVGTTSKVGIGYNDILRDFVRDFWRPEVAANECGTLRRTLHRLQEMNGVV